MNRYNDATRWANSVNHIERNELVEKTAQKIIRHPKTNFEFILFKDGSIGFNHLTMFDDDIGYSEANKDDIKKEYYRTQAIIERRRKSWFCTKTQTNKLQIYCNEIKSLLELSKNFNKYCYDNY